MSKTILITGASRGLGRIWAESLLERGDQVVAAVRNTDSLKTLSETYPETLLVLPLDLTDRKACNEVIESTIVHFGKLDVLINNAGYGHSGAIEELSEDEVRNQFETNVFGLLWLTQAAIPVMREQKSGHIIQVSSALGQVTFPTTGIYAASKFAVEAISESLAAEVAPFGIKVTILEPNGYETEFGSSSGVMSKPLSIYEPVREAVKNSSNPDDWGVPSATAPAMLKLIDSTEPPLRLILGKAGFEWIKYTYAERMKTWESWNDVSVSAHGK